MVTGGTDSDVGGLVGYMYSGGTITQSYATGGVRASGTFPSAGGLVGESAGTTTQSYATGAVSSAAVNVGGLVGYNLGIVSQTYATGAVSGNGGLVGQNAGTITQSYAIGATTGTHADAVVGVNDGGNGGSNYYNSDTSGASSTYATGRTTSQLKSALPTGFDSSVWATGSGLYPYLKSIYPNGVQAITGTAQGSNGTSVSGAQVGVYANGGLLTGGTASTGANGAFYEIVSAGTLATSNLKVGATIAPAGSNAASGLSYTDAASVNRNILSLGTLKSGVDTQVTAETTYSALQTDLSATFGSANLTSLQSALASTSTGITATGAGFTLDQAVTTSSAFSVQTTASGAPLTVANTITIGNGGSLGLDAAGALAIDANITVSDPGSVALTAPMTSVSILDGNATIGLLGLTFAQGASLSFTGTNVMTGAPLGSLSINGQAYTLENSLASLSSDAKANNNGHYALATNVDGSNNGMGYGGPVVSTLNGTLEGLGHTVSNLTISDGGDVYVGFIGRNNGTVRDIGLVGGAIFGGGSNSNVGPLVGSNGGTIANAYATSIVEASGSMSSAGGLVGSNAGTIANAYATGAVGGGANSTVGGLAGSNSADSNVASIINVYATGAVSGGSYADVGGLVGSNVSNFGTASIADAYATGAVSGGSHSYLGGLVGLDSVAAGQGVASVTNGSYDTQTTGLTSDGGGATGLTTAQLQGTLPIGFNPAIWGTGIGLYPYLKSFYPTTPQAVSGMAGTAARGAQVAIYSGGALLNGSTVSAGAATSNGYFYEIVPAGTLAASNIKIGAALTLSGASTVSGLSYTDTGSISNTVLSLGVLASGTNKETTAETTYSALQTDLGTTFGATTLTASNAALAATPTSISATGPSFTVDQAVTAGAFVLSTTAVRGAADGRRADRGHRVRPPEHERRSDHRVERLGVGRKPRARDNRRLHQRGRQHGGDGHFRQLADLFRRAGRRHLRRPQ